MGFIDFTNGEVLTADQMDLVMRQGIMRFADAAARDTALSEVLAEGMMAYLDDTDEVLKYDGSQWIDISGDITGVTAGTALTGGGTSGNVTLDVDESALTIAQSQVTDLVSDLADKQDDVITTEGDLVIGDASGDPVRLPVGSADQVLTSDGTTVSFQDAGGGGGGGFTEIASLTPSSSSFTVSGLSGFDDIFVRCDNIQFSGNGAPLTLKQINGVNITGFIQRWQMDQTGSGSVTVTPDSDINLAQNNVGSSANATIQFFGASDNNNLIFRAVGGGINVSDSSITYFTQGVILKSAPLNSFTLDSDFRTMTGGTVRVYGR